VSTSRLDGVGVCFWSEKSSSICGYVSILVPPISVMVRKELTSSRMSLIRLRSSTFARAFISRRSPARCWHCSVTLVLSVAYQEPDGKENEHLQTIFPRKNIHAVTVRGRAMLARWLFASTFDLVGTTLKMCGSAVRNRTKLEKQPGLSGHGKTVGHQGKYEFWHPPLHKFVRDSDSLQYRLVALDVCLLPRQYHDQLFASVGWQLSAG